MSIGNGLPALSGLVRSRDCMHFTPPRARARGAPPQLPHTPAPAGYCVVTGLQGAAFCAGEGSVLVVIVRGFARAGEGAHYRARRATGRGGCCELPSSARSALDSSRQPRLWRSLSLSLPRLCDARWLTAAALISICVMDISLLQRVDSLSPALFRRVQSEGATSVEREDADQQKQVVPERQSRSRTYSTELECALRNLAKGAAVGYGGRTAFALVAVALGKRRATVRGVLASTEHARWAAFLGSFLAIHNSVMRGKRKMSPSGEHFRGAIAGAVAGITSICFAPAHAKPQLALLLAVRAAEVAARSAAQRGVIPPVLADNADVKLMSAASAVVMSCWIFQPRALDASYLRFLNRQSGKDVRLLRAIAAAFDGDLSSKPGVLAALNDHRVAVSLQPLTLPPAHGCEHCNVLHLPAESCEGHLCTYLAAAWLRALPLYAPVHILPLLLFWPGLLLRKPGTVLPAALLKVSRSALFLASFCTSGFAILCASARLAQAAGVRSRRWHAQLGSALCGLTLFIEKPGRRLELALYTFTQALRCMPHPGSNDALRRFGSVPLFALASGVVSHHYVRHPGALRPSYAALLTRFLDTTGGTHRRLLS